MAKEEKDRQHNGQRRKGQTTQWPKKKRTDNTMAKEEKDNRTNDDLQNTTHKTKDRVTRTPLKTGGQLRCSGRVGSASELTESTLYIGQKSIGFNKLYNWVH
jgi:hypothetical protein